MDRLFAIVMIIFLFLGQSNHVFAMMTNSELNTLADEALQLVRTERYAEAEKLLKKINQQLLKHHVLSADEKRILQSSYREATRILKDEPVLKQEAIRKIMKYRLIVDTVMTEHEPLWINMEQSVLTAFQLVKDAYYLQDNQLFLNELNRFLSIYDIIYPSIVLDISVEKVQRIDTQIQYLEQNSSQMMNQGDGIEAIEALQTDLQALFEENETEEDEADPSLWWVIISTGGIIISTLSYVGWRKYKGEKERREKIRKGQKN